MGLYGVEVKEEELVKIPIWDYRKLIQTEHKYLMVTSAILNQSKVSDYGNLKHILFPDVDKLFRIIEPELIKTGEDKLLKGEEENVEG